VWFRERYWSDLEFRWKRAARCSDYYWFVRRSRTLAGQRGHALEQLAELEELAAALYREAGLEPPTPEPWVVRALS